MSSNNINNIDLIRSNEISYWEWIMEHVSRIGLVWMIGSGSKPTRNPSYYVVYTYRTHRHKEAKKL